MEVNFKNYWAGFFFIKNIGPQTQKKLMDFFSNGLEAWGADYKYLCKAGLPPKLAQFVATEKNKINIQIILEKIQEENIRVISRYDTEYPRILKEAHGSPPILYCKGNAKILNQAINVAIVGTRKCSEYARKHAKEFAGVLVQNNITIVSGLAKGVDTAAHCGALASNGNTIAVLGTSLVQKDMYPKENIPISQDIIKHGALISEFPPYSPIVKENFPRRNRIVSGLSKAVIVVEAPKKSGSLITARYALEQNRDVFALPGEINKINAQGTNQLIKQGAQIITETHDLYEYFNIHPSKEAITNKMKCLDIEEQSIFRLLEHGPQTMDTLLQATKLGPRKLNMHLINMEISQVLKNSGGKYHLR